MSTEVRPQHYYVETLSNGTIRGYNGKNNYYTIFHNVMLYIDNITLDNIFQYNYTYNNRTYSNDSNMLPLSSDYECETGRFESCNYYGFQGKGDMNLNYKNSGRFYRGDSIFRVRLKSYDTTHTDYNKIYFRLYDSDDTIRANIKLSDLNIPQDNKTVYITCWLDINDSDVLVVRAFRKNSDETAGTTTYDWITEKRYNVNSSSYPKKISVNTPMYVGFHFDTTRDFVEIREYAVWRRPLYFYARINAYEVENYSLTKIQNYANIVRYPNDVKFHVALRDGYGIDHVKHIGVHLFLNNVDMGNLTFNDDGVGEITITAATMKSKGWYNNDTLTVTLKTNNQVNRENGTSSIEYNNITGYVDTTAGKLIQTGDSTDNRVNKLHYAVVPFMEFVSGKQEYMGNNIEQTIMVNVYNNSGNIVPLVDADVSCTYTNKSGVVTSKTIKTDRNGELITPFTVYSNVKYSSKCYYVLSSTGYYKETYSFNVNWLYVDTPVVTITSDDSFNYPDDIELVVTVKNDSNNDNSHAGEAIANATVALYKIVNDEVIRLQEDQTFRTNSNGKVTIHQNRETGTRPLREDNAWTFRARFTGYINGERDYGHNAVNSSTKDVKYIHRPTIKVLSKDFDVSTGERAKAVVTLINKDNEVLQSETTLTGTLTVKDRYNEELKKFNITKETLVWDDDDFGYPFRTKKVSKYNSTGVMLFEYSGSASKNGEYSKAADVTVTGITWKKAKTSQNLAIIILTNDEQVITWLDPNLADFKETNKIESCRKIEITYPIEDNYSKKRLDESWFNIGNKIYVPGALGLTSCLYIINTEYQLDLIKENHITITAEEVLTELNYDVLALYDETITITKNMLKTYFSEYYDIGEVDTLKTKKKISPNKTLTLMELLRLIEETTGYVFITEYVHDGLTVERTLHLKNESKLRHVSSTEFLDLNYNLHRLDLTVNESDVYTAMAPILNGSTNEVTSTTTAKDVSVGIVAGDSNKLTTNNDKNKFKQVLEDYLNLEVRYREEIPMILETNSDGDIVSKANWYAPFNKDAGSLILYQEYTHDVSYDLITFYNSEKRGEYAYKCGTMSTSETNPYAIYNAVANALLKKQAPNIKVEVEVKEIETLLELDMLGYQLYETMNLRVPGFDYFIPCMVTETVKDPHRPSSDKITLETNVKGFYEQHGTRIEANDKIIGAKQKSSIGGTLLDLDNEEKGIENAIITMSVKLETVYDDTVKKQTGMLLNMDSTKETYIFSGTEIESVAEAMKNDRILGTEQDWYRVTAIDGKNYKVPHGTIFCLYNAYIQAFINSDNTLGEGAFPKTLTIHQIGNINSLSSTDNINLYYEFFGIMNDCYIDQLISDDYDENYLAYQWGATDKQTNNNCVPSALSNLSRVFYDYHSELELATLLGTVEGGTNLERVAGVVTQLGWSYEIISFNLERFRNMDLFNQGILVFVESSRFGYTQTGIHAVLITGFYPEEEGFLIEIMDSNKPWGNPQYWLNHTHRNIFQDMCVTYDYLLNAACVGYNGSWYTTNNNSEKKCMLIKQTSKNVSVCDDHHI